MRLPILLLAAFSCASGQPRVDNVLVKMVPPGSLSLVGTRMDAIKDTDLYRKLVESRNLPQLDLFARQTGFDPRRDVREFLLVDTRSGGVILARGTFRINADELLEGRRIVRHGEYNVTATGGTGFCILDSTLVVAGDLESVLASLDEWKSGTHTAAQPLLAEAKEVNPSSHVWGVSAGFAGFPANHMPATSTGVDFSKILKGLKNIWFQADFTGGFKGEIHGATATDEDAVNLRDTAKGLIGFGRLSVPQNQAEMLKLWDGIAVEQDGRSLKIRADIPTELLDRLIQLIGSAPSGRGRALLPALPPR
ncbi:MAG: hypothetical protein ABSB15_05400 [Bryobacteraceae bacterium]